MSDLLSALSHFPLSNTFVLVGILLWVLAITGSVAGKITVEPAKQKTAALVGSAFIGLGLILMFVPGPANQGEPEATAKTTQTTGSPKQTTEPPPAQTTAPVTAEKKAELPPLAKPDQNRTRPSPGVDCTDTGTPDEIEICGNTRLSDLDWELYRVYHALLGRLDKNRQANLKNEESAWVKDRGKCQSNERCLTEAYKSRIEQLQSVQ